MEKKDKLLCQCTLGELCDYLQEHLIINQGDGQCGTTPKRYVYGIKGLQEIFRCCHTTACRIKKSGIIDDAISQSQIGSKIVIDAELALELIRCHKSKKHG